MKKQRTLLKPLTIFRYVRLILNVYSPLFLNNTLWNVGQSIVFFFFSSSFITGMLNENFQGLLGRAMKLSIQALQQYIILPVHS